RWRRLLRRSRQHDRHQCRSWRGPRGPRPRASAECARIGALLAGWRWGRIAHLEAGETGHRDVFAQLGDLRFDQLVDGNGGFLDEGLLVEADLFVILADAAFHDLLGNLFRLALIDYAGLLDILFLVEYGCGHVLAADKAGV